MGLEELSRSSVLEALGMRFEELATPDKWVEKRMRDYEKHLTAWRLEHWY